MTPANAKRSPRKLDFHVKVDAEEYAQILAGYEASVERKKWGLSLSQFIRSTLLKALR